MLLACVCVCVCLCVAVEMKQEKLLAAGHLITNDSDANAGSDADRATAASNGA